MAWIRQDDNVRAAILALLTATERPIGASVIHDELVADGYRLSEPTVGRLLRELDRSGYTSRQGRLGRLVTAAGRSELDRLRADRSRQGKSARLLESIRTETLTDVMNVMAARRAIEREIARSAAQNATAEEIADLQRLAHELEAGRSASGLHARLAAAAHNPVLESAYQLINHDPGIQRVVDAVLLRRDRYVDAVFNRDLIQAIADRDPDAAEAAVASHLERIHADLEQFWAEIK